MSGSFLPSKEWEREERLARSSVRGWVMMGWLLSRPFVWTFRGLRYAAFGTLAVLEPFVLGVLGLIAVVCLGCALFLKVVQPPNAPVLLFLALGVGAGFLLVSYYLIARLVLPKQ